MAHRPRTPRERRDPPPRRSPCWIGPETPSLGGRSNPNGTLEVSALSEEDPQARLRRVLAVPRFGPIQDVSSARCPQLPQPKAGGCTSGGLGRKTSGFFPEVASWSPVGESFCPFPSVVWAWQDFGGWNGRGVRVCLELDTWIAWVAKEVAEVERLIPRGDG
jgi:hypothetical protein